MHTRIINVYKNDFKCVRRWYHRYSRLLKDLFFNFEESKILLVSLVPYDFEEQSFFHLLYFRVRLNDFSSPKTFRNKSIYFFFNSTLSVNLKHLVRAAKCFSRTFNGSQGLVNLNDVIKRDRDTSIKARNLVHSRSVGGRFAVYFIFFLKRSNNAFLCPGVPDYLARAVRAWPWLSINHCIGQPTDILFYFIVLFSFRFDPCI